MYARVQKAKTGLLEYVKEQIAAETDAEKAAHMKDVYGLLARNPYLFKFGKQKLAESRSRLAKMTDICATFPVFNHLRLLKEGFERIYEESPDRATAEALYAEWSELVPPKKGTKMISNWESRYGVPASLYKELVTFYTTTQNWYKEIFNYFDPGCQFTNAASEGVNSMIQRINAQGDGYGFKRLRAKALYSSNMGGRISYSINREQVPIYGKTSGENPPGTIGLVMDFVSKPQIIGYRAMAEVVMVQGDGVNPLNVYEYVASDAEYYDFDEEFYDTDEV